MTSTHAGPAPIPTSGKTYPGPITPALLAQWSHIPDDQVEQDLADTEQEIVEVERLNALDEAACESAHLADSEKRMRGLKIDHRRATNRQRVAFCAFLRRLQAARAEATR